MTREFCEYRPVNSGKKENKMKETLMKRFGLCLGAAVFTVNAWATIWYVDGTSGSDVNTGLDTGSAKASIQAAVDVSSSGDTILVAHGVYTSIDTQGKDIVIRSTGGAANTKIVNSTDYGLGLSSAIVACLISDSTNSQIGDSSEDDVSYKYDVANEWRSWTPENLPGSTLEGFTIEVNSIPSILIDGEYYGVVGGRVKNCRFTCSDNLKGYAHLSLSVAENCLFASGVLSEECISDSILRNCTVYTGAYLCSIKMQNTIVYARNSKVYLDEGDVSPTLSNCVFYNVKNASKRTGVTVADPKFVNASSGNFQLQASSPCIDKGAGSYGTTDLAGNARVVNGKIDIGCYEYQNSITTDPVVPDDPEVPDFVFESGDLCNDVGGEVLEVIEKAAQVYDGCLYDGVGDVAGSIQIKVAKAKTNRKTGETTSKVTVTIQVVGETKKVTVSGNLDVDMGLISLTVKDGRELTFEIGADGVLGTFGAYTFDGVRNLFSSKDKAEAKSVNDVANALKAQGAIAIMWEDNLTGGFGILSVSIGAKGKTKVSGTMPNGTKVSVSTQLIVGEETCCVPVLYTKKKTSLAFCLWLSRNGVDLDISGLGDAIEVGHASALYEGAVFWLDCVALSGLLGDDTYEDYLPGGIEITTKGTKWVLPKVGKVVLDRYGDVNESKLGENPSGLKLAYKAKDGTFTGSFKAYTDVNGKLKATTVSVSGIVIDGIGYGTATLKKVGSVPVTIE